MSVFMVCERAIGLVRGNRLILGGNERGMLEALDYEGLAGAGAQDEALSCARHFAAVRDGLLSVHPWVFARRTSSPARLTAETDGWRYAYVIPLDCLRVLRVLSKSPLAVTTLRHHLHEELKWEIYGGHIVCNHEDIVIRYTSRIEDTQKWDPMFADAFVMLLAGEIAAEVQGDISARERFAESARMKISEAYSAAAIQADAGLPKRSGLWLDYSGVPTMFEFGER